MIQWTEDLSVGVDLIDEQHQALIARIADVETAINTGKGEAEVAKTLEFLKDYTEHHFSTEETNMKALNYPNLDEHLAQHARFNETLNHMINEFREEGATALLAVSIKTLLFNWFVGHIKEIDQKLSDFVNEKGATLS